MFNWHDLIALMPTFMPVAFFWACRCCDGECEGWCPGAPQSTYQLSAPTGLFDEGNGGGEPCEEGQCAEREGEFTMSLSGDPATDWVTLNGVTYPEGACVWTGTEFRACLRFEFISEEETEIEEADFQYVAQTLKSVDNFTMLIYLIVRSTIDASVLGWYRWDIDMTAEGFTCEDDLEGFAYNAAASSPPVEGCLIDEMLTLDMLIPP